jgi:DoxX-like protein
VAASGKAVWAGRVISALPIPMFLISAFFKLKGGPQVEEGFAHLGLPLTMMKPLAVLELSCVLVYVIPQTAVLGAILLAGYLGGAICTHWRAGDAVYVHIVLGLVLWLGVYLRDRRLRDLIPIRK